MGAIPEADPDEPVETKPFKFVTGEFVPACLRANGRELRSIANLLAAGTLNLGY
jgi:hypothetical protein